MPKEELGGEGSGWQADSYISRIISIRCLHTVYTTIHAYRVHTCIYNVYTCTCTIYMYMYMYNMHVYIHACAMLDTLVHIIMKQRLRVYYIRKLYQPILL